MNQSLQFAVKKRLQSEDYGEQVDDGFFMADLGRHGGAPQGPSITTEGLNKTRPKTRAERIKLADGMAARLMDEYMKPSALNDPNVLNPIRDGIPQCSRHPFESGHKTKIGCIHGCGNRERQGSAGVLPVSKEHTVSDVWHWIQALVRKAVEESDHRAGFTR